MNLYVVTCVYQAYSVSETEVFVVAENPNEAQNKVLKRLQEMKYSYDRADKIILVASEVSYKASKILVL